MNSNMIVCPKCGNVQPQDSVKCFKCNSKLSTLQDYTKSVDNERYSSHNKKREINFGRSDKSSSPNNHLRIIAVVILSAIAIVILAILIINIVLFKDTNDNGPADGIKIVYKIKNKNFSEDDLKNTVDIIRKRADILDIDIGVKEDIVVRTITVTVSKDVEDFDSVTKYLSRPGELYFIYGKGPTGNENISYTADGDVFLTRPMNDIIANGDAIIFKNEIIEALPKKYSDQYSGDQFVVQLIFSTAGSNKFTEATRYSYSYFGSESLANKIAIVFDDDVLSAPQVSSVIEHGEAQIQGLKDMAEGRILAQFIKSESLPLELEIVNK